MTRYDRAAFDTWNAAQIRARYAYLANPLAASTCARCLTHRHRLCNGWLWADAQRHACACPHPYHHPGTQP